MVKGMCNNWEMYIPVMCIDRRGHAFCVKLRCVRS